MRKQPDEYAQLVKRERNHQGLSVHDLAAKSGVSAATISRFERGFDTYWTHVVAILTALGISLLQPGPCPHEYVCRLCEEPLPQNPRQGTGMTTTC